MKTLSSPEIPVALIRSKNYKRNQLKNHIAELVKACGFTLSPGARLLLKPNLVAAARRCDPACTHPDFVAAAAEYFVDCGAKVRIGDSPATGGGLRAMAISGMSESLSRLAVEQVEFSRTRTQVLPCGIRLQVARQALECDALINLPKVKAHSQLRVTLAMKNYFGVVKGWRKVMAHQMHGANQGRRFLDLLLELPDILPGGITLVDGIEAMHGTGPIHGKKYKLELLGAACNAQALDTALLDVLGVDGADSPLWQAAANMEAPGTRREMLYFPLARPDELRVAGFKVPTTLVPVRFSLRHVMGSLANRIKVFRRKRRQRYS